MDRSLPADRALFYLFIGLLVWLPLPKGSVFPWTLAIQVVLSLAIISGWLLLFLNNRVHFSRPLKPALPVFVLLLATQVWVLYTLGGLSLEQTRSQHQLLQGLSLVAIFACTLLMVRSKRRILITLYALILSGIAQAVYGSLMTLSGVEYNLFFPKEHYLGVATGTFVNRNHLAGYLELCLAVGVGFMIATLKERSANWRDFGRRVLEALLGSKARVRIGLVIMVAALVMTHSRMGNTAFFASLTITGIIALLLGKRASRATTILLTSLIIIDLVVVGTFFGVEKVVDRLENTSMSTVNRDEVYQYAMPLLEEHLITGSGVGSFYTVFPEARQPDLGALSFMHGHNDYLQFAMEFGLIGFIPLLLAVVLTFIVALRAQWLRRDPLMRGLSFASMMGIIAFGIHSTVDFNLQIPANAATFMVILALGWISMYHKERGQLRGEPES